MTTMSRQIDRAVENARARDLRIHLERQDTTDVGAMIDTARAISADVEELMADCDESGNNLAWVHLQNALTEIELAKGAIHGE